MDQFTEQTAETASSTITVKQLGPHAGAEIHGINTADPLNEMDVQTINDALMALLAFCGSSRPPAK